MNVQRSPQKRMPTGGGSQPDLSKMSCATDVPQITLRKRKQPIDSDCGCSNELKEMRKELKRVSTLLEKYVESNGQILSKMQESIAEVRTQINEIKKSNEETTKSLRDNVIEVRTELNNLKNSSTIMFTEHKDIKNKITELEAQVDNKIKSFKDDVNKLNPQSSGPSLANNIPKIDQNDFNYVLPKILSQNMSDFSVLKPCTNNEITKIIANLDNNCSIGIDGINTKVIKCAQSNSYSSNTMLQ
ncbi:unnamed protein product [Parnassius mnemosyne]|uniref:Uncharacterized protein n=1 Tax=Parnassius mnemosyne TaxID=213953 RepID=A0AAV1LNA3_9NEOP